MTTGLQRDAVFLGGTSEQFAFLTYPDRAPRATGIVILNAGLLPSAGPHWMHVGISERLAAQGYAVARIDQSGKGESSRLEDLSRSESLLLDYDRVFEKLHAAGIEQTIIIGLCSGADDGSYIATERDTVAGLVMLDGYGKRCLGYYLRHYGERVFFPAAWWRALRNRFEAPPGGILRSDDNAGMNIRDWPGDDAMQQRFADLLRRGGSLLAVYTSGQDYYNAEGQLASRLRGKAPTANLAERYFADVDHLYTLPAHRERLGELLEDWLKNRF